MKSAPKPHTPILAHAGALLALLLGAQAQAAAPLDATSLFIDCQGLRYVGVSCERLSNGYFSLASNIVRAQSSQEATISVRITDEAAAGSPLRVRYDWSSRDDLEVSDFSVVLKFRPNEQQDILLTGMIDGIVQGMAPHLKVLSFTSADVLTVTYETGTTGTKPPTKFAQGPLFFELSFSGNSNRTGIGATNPDGTLQGETSSQNFFGSLGTHYSSDRIRLFGSMNMGHNASQYPDGRGGTINAENATRGITLLNVYSLRKLTDPVVKKKGLWSVLLAYNQSSAPAANIEMNREIGTGLEWSLVPFRVNENKDIRVMMGMGRATTRLVAPNGRGNLEENFTLVTADLRFYWLTLNNRVTLEAGAGYRGNLSIAGYSSYSGHGRVRYQITDGIALHYNLSYRRTSKSLTYPGVVTSSNFVQNSFLSSGQAGGSFNQNAGVSFGIGNGLRRTRDRRGGLN